MTERQKETAFLKRLIVCDDHAERRQLEGRLLQAERDERVVRQAVAFVALLTALAVAGLGYSAILLPDFPSNRSQFVLKLFLIIGLGSGLCLMAYGCVWVRCRRLLNKVRDECRRLVTSLLDEQSLREHMIPFPQPVQGQVFPVYQNETPPVAEDDADRRCSAI